MYKGIYGTLEKDLINIGAFKEYKINLIYKIENVKSNKRKSKEFEKAILELAMFSTWLWVDMLNSLRLKHRIQYRLYNILELEKTNPFEMYFINNYIYNRISEIVKNNEYKIELEDYYV